MMASSDSRGRREDLSQRTWDLLADRRSRKAPAAFFSWEQTPREAPHPGAAPPRRTSGTGYVPSSRRDGPLRVLSGTELLDLPDPEWLVSDVLPKTGTFILFGPSGAGKSFVVQDLLLSASTGSRWLDHFEITDPGAVLYVAAEGGGDLAARARGWLQGRGLEPAALSGYNVVIEEGVNLLDAWDPAEVTQICQAKEVRLVVFDTLAEHMPGGDENSGRDGGLALRALKKLATDAGCLVGVVHHTGHGNGDRGRGWSGFKAGVDAELSFDAGILKATKNRYGPPLEPVGVELRPVGGTLVPYRVETYAAAAVLADELAFRLVEVITKTPGRKWNDIKASVGGNASTLARVRDELVDDGVLRVEKVGNTKRYYPVEPIAGDERLAWEPAGTNDSDGDGSGEGPESRIDRNQ